MLQPTEQEFTNILQDCLSAVSTPILALKDYVSFQRKHVQKTLGVTMKGMPIIQQQTDREGSEEKNTHIFNEIKKMFNSQVGKIIQTKEEVQDLIEIYKSQLILSAQQFKKELRKMEKSFSEQEDLKKSRKRKSVQNRSPASQKKQEEQELQIRPAPSPFSQNQCSKCPLLTERVQTLEKQSRSWKSLSTKIDDFKKRINSYALQIKAKDEQIAILQGRLSQAELRSKSEKDEQQKKRLKKDNTALRGQKVLLSNQLASVRRQLAEKTSVADALQTQNIRLRMDVDNLNTSLNWHSNNLSQLRVGVAKSRNEEWKEIGGKMDSLVRVNRVLNQNLSQNQEMLIQFNQKSKQAQQSLNRHIQKKDRKIMELEAMLQDKNETIIRLKTGGKLEKADRGGYHADMVKVLNKRLAQRQERVRVLEDALARVDNQ